MTVGLASTCAVAWVAIAGTSVADAATRYRSGAVHRDLLDSATRIAPNSAAAGLHLTGSDVIAAFVGFMAVTAFLFLVVTLIRRRVPHLAV